jgi:hypothetical protein
MKINKKEFVDLKNLDKLVPSEYLHKINLLFNKDVPKIPNNADELIIKRLSELKETNVQQFFYKQSNLLQCELKSLNRFNELEFVQNDNGDGGAGNISNTQRMALFARKKAEGSRKGFPDVSMYVSVSATGYRDTTFCEVKKIGAPSEIHLTQEQLHWFIKFNDMGFNAYITNNPIFFRDVILNEIKKKFI